MPVVCASAEAAAALAADFRGNARLATRTDQEPSHGPGFAAAAEVAAAASATPVATAALAAAGSSHSDQMFAWVCENIHHELPSDSSDLNAQEARAIDRDADEGAQEAKARERAMLANRLQALLLDESPPDSPPAVPQALGVFATTAGADLRAATWSDRAVTPAAHSAMAVASAATAHSAASRSAEAEAALGAAAIGATALGAEAAGWSHTAQTALSLTEAEAATHLVEATGLPAAARSAADDARAAVAAAASKAAEEAVRQARATEAAAWLAVDLRATPAATAPRSDASTGMRAAAEVVATAAAAAAGGHAVAAQVNCSARMDKGAESVEAQVRQEAVGWPEPRGAGGAEPGVAVGRLMLASNIRPIGKRASAPAAAGSTGTARASLLLASCGQIHTAAASCSQHQPIPSSCRQPPPASAKRCHLQPAGASCQPAAAHRQPQPPLTGASGRQPGSAQPAVGMFAEVLDQPADPPPPGRHYALEPVGGLIWVLLPSGDRLAKLLDGPEKEFALEVLAKGNSAWRPRFGQPDHAKFGRQLPLKAAQGSRPAQRHSRPAAADSTPPPASAGAAGYAPAPVSAVAAAPQILQDAVLSACVCVFMHELQQAGQQLEQEAVQEEGLRRASTRTHSLRRLQVRSGRLRAAQLPWQVLYNVCTFDGCPAGGDGHGGSASTRA